MSPTHIGITVTGAIMAGLAILRGDFAGALKILVESACKAVGIDPKPVMALLKKAAGAIKLIFKNPIRFVKTFIKAIGMAFDDFKDNFGKYLKAGLQTFVFGEVGKAGTSVPEHDAS